MGKKILDLTKREIDVLRLVAKGLGNAEICDVLGLKHTTIVTHLKHIYDKVGISYGDNKPCSAYRVRATLFYLENREAFENERL